MLPVIDAHTHLYPPELAADPAGWAQRAGEPHWSALVSPPGRRSLQGWPDVDTMLAQMDRAGVERAVLLGWYWERPENSALHNAFYAKLLREQPDRFLAFASTVPGHPEALDELRRALDSGFHGIGELLPQIVGESLRGPGMEAVLAVAAEYKVPVNLHVTEPVGRDHPGRVETPLQDFLDTAQAFPQVRFLLAHWGGGLPFYAANPAVREVLAQGNVFFDCAASPLLYGPEVYALVTRAVGAERILFGTDYPLRVYPRRQTEPSIHEPLEELRTSGLSPEDERKVCYDNTRALFGLA